METAELMKLFGFTSRDLAANRRGALSLAQEGRLKQRIAFVIIGVAVFVWAISQGLAAAKASEPQQAVFHMPGGEEVPAEGLYHYPPTHLILSSCVSFSYLVISGFVLVYQGMRGKLESEIVRNVEGLIRVERHELHIKNFKFDISWHASERLLAAYEKSKLGGTYIVYYRVKNDQRILVSIERISSEPWW